MQGTKAKQTKTSNKGITLVALVITIIVLLILAAVGIGAIAGEDGLITKAQEAAELYEQASRNEANAINEIFNMVNGGNQGGSEEPTQPVIDATNANVKFTYTPSTPTKGSVTVEITTTTGYMIQYKIGETGNYSRYTGSFTVEENTEIYVKLANSSGVTGGYATGNVQNIDKVAPNAFTPTIGEITENSIEISASTIDTGSPGCAAINTGIKEYRYYVNGELKDYGLKENVTITGLTAGTEYSIYVIAEDKAGNPTISSVVTAETTIPLISTTETYVGYYISTDNDNEPDGIIYGDRLQPVSGEWGNDYGGGTYTIDEIEQAKEYYICANDYTGEFGTADVIKAVNEEEEGKRFYVMALEDVVDEENNSVFCWYDDAYDNMNPKITSLEVGTGAENTRKMIENWNGPNGYGEPNTGSYPDVWGIAEVQAKAEEGWYVPSRGEWAAFADAFDISVDSSSPNYYVNLGLSSDYWSSSQDYTYSAWLVDFEYGYLGNGSVRSRYYVRLGGTF